MAASSSMQRHRTQITSDLFLEIKVTACQSSFWDQVEWESRIMDLLELCDAIMSTWTKMNNVSSMVLNLYHEEFRSLPGTSEVYPERGQWVYSQSEMLKIIQDIADFVSAFRPVLLCSSFYSHSLPIWHHKHSTLYETYKIILENHDTSIHPSIFF